MVYVKRLVMQGFKSFVKKTELSFTTGINVILGPNGSGKSNVSDALCFVLGRLSIKSMRAAKARNLIFLGTKAIGPAKEASVEIVFDNSDKVFSIDQDEVAIRRIVRRNGQSIYKINNEIKTRQEVLSLLAQAGIDPNGFNIILQGEIQNFVRMHTEERRKIIEEVSGISIYESRKVKSIRELDKTEDKLKEVMAVLRERTAYLNNLERERQQALKFKKLEREAKTLKASVIFQDLSSRKKEVEKVNNNINTKNNEVAKVKQIIANLELRIKDYELKIDTINSTIQKSTGLEQEQLNQEIANIRADLAGLNVKEENTERKIFEIEKQTVELNESIRNNVVLVKELEKESPTLKKKQKDIESKKKELEVLEEQRKKYYITKTELKSLSERLQDKRSTLQTHTTESDYLLKQIDTLALDLYDKSTTSNQISGLRMSIGDRKQQLTNLDKKEIDLAKQIHTNDHEIKKLNRLSEDVSKLDVCPLCKNKITEDHIHSIKDEARPKIVSLTKDIDDSSDEIEKMSLQKAKLTQETERFVFELSQRESDIIRSSNIESKKDQVKSLNEKIQETKGELGALEKRKKFLESNFGNNSNIEQRYETTRIEVQEISLRNAETLDSEISFKHRELERNKIASKQFVREKDDLTEELATLQAQINQRQELLDKKRKQDEELGKKFREMIAERDSLQVRIRQGDSELSLKQNIIYNLEQDVNDYKIGKARVSAEIGNLEMEMLEFKEIKIIKSSRETLLHKLHRTQDMLSKIGNVNLRSLEVYDGIKKEYDLIKEKVEILSNEKESIMKIIYAIDIKKKKTFLKTLNELNEVFSRNFSQLSTKGQVYLDLENRKEPFEGGVGIVVKTGHGKYFDVTSLSGGEQTLVALSLIFAIQELNPYCFYILDEIDAALDKRNSERLANLLQKYMMRGQYIVITHNDEIIGNATNLYGISMHDGVSKVTSLKL